ncbi:MAG: MFS transporter, partial [Nostoc sp.]
KQWLLLSIILPKMIPSVGSTTVVYLHENCCNSVFISASNELGGFESGLTAALFGPVISVVGGGIGTIVVVIATAMIWPGIRKLGALQEYK